MADPGPGLRRDLGHPRHQHAGLRPLLLTLTALALILPVLQLSAAHASLDKRLAVETQLRWQTILDRPLPADAILVSNDRDEVVPLLYLQQIEDRSPGLTGLFPRSALIRPGPTCGPRWIAPWPRAGLCSRSNRCRGWRRCMRWRRCRATWLHVLSRQPAPDPSFEYPYGDYLRWLNLEWWGDALPGGELHITLYWRVTQTPPQTWHSFLQVYNAAGERIKQADDHRPGGVYLPSPLWRPGDVRGRSLHPAPAGGAAPRRLHTGGRVLQPGHRAAWPTRCPWRR